jgi:hypothetical protein
MYRGRSAAIAGLGQFDQPSTAGGDQRVLADDEERVANHQQHCERETEFGPHLLDGLLPVLSWHHG